MFRIAKKWTAAVYQSQKDPSEGVVMVPATLWVNGDIDECGFLPMYVFTNCDYVEFYYGDKQMCIRDRVPGFNSYSFPCSFRTPLPLLISQKRDI